MHEKRAREKEKRLLEQEKELYQARIRSQIRSKLAGRPDPFTEPESDKGHGPMNPNDHIKALADRFVKEGAEDLWNERDGPLKTPSSAARLNQRPRPITGPPIDLRKLTSERHASGGNQDGVNLSNLSGNYVRARSYSVQSRRRSRRNESSSSEDELGSDSKRNSVKSFVQSFVGNRESSHFPRNANDFVGDKKFSAQKQRKLWRNGSSSSDEEEEEEETQMDSEDDSGRFPRRDVRKMGSSASLGKYDMKVKRRVPLNSLDEVGDFAEQIELIRHELSKKNSRKKEEEDKGNDGDECILSQKRYIAVSFL